MPVESARGQLSGWTAADRRHWQLVGWSSAPSPRTQPTAAAGRIRAVTDSAVALESTATAEVPWTSRLEPVEFDRPGEDEPDLGEHDEMGARRTRLAALHWAEREIPFDDPGCDRVRAVSGRHTGAHPHARVDDRRPARPDSPRSWVRTERWCGRWTPPHDFGRIAAMTAKQVILQRLRRRPTRRTTGIYRPRRRPWSPVIRAHEAAARGSSRSTWQGGRRCLRPNRSR